MLPAEITTTPKQMEMLVLCIRMGFRFLDFRRLSDGKLVWRNGTDKNCSSHYKLHKSGVMYTWRRHNGKRYGDVIRYDYQILLMSYLNGTIRVTTD